MRGSAECVPAGAFHSDAVPELVTRGTAFRRAEWTRSGHGLGPGNVSSGSRGSRRAIDVGVGPTGWTTVLSGRGSPKARSRDIGEKRVALRFGAGEAVRGVCVRSGGVSVSPVQLASTQSQLDRPCWTVSVCLVVGAACRPRLSREDAQFRSLRLGLRPVNCANGWLRRRVHSRRAASAPVRLARPVMRLACQGRGVGRRSRSRRS